MFEQPDLTLDDASNQSFDILCVDAIELVTDYLDDALSISDLDRFQAHLGKPTIVPARGGASCK